MCWVRIQLKMLPYVPIITEATADFVEPQFANAQISDQTTTSKVAKSVNRFAMVEMSWIKECIKQVRRRALVLTASQLMP